MKNYIVKLNSVFLFHLIHRNFFLFYKQILIHFLNIIQQLKTQNSSFYLLASSIHLNELIDNNFTIIYNKSYSCNRLQSIDLDWRTNNTHNQLFMLISCGNYKSIQTETYF
jgi:hypothetical protein